MQTIKVVFSEVSSDGPVLRKAIFDVTHSNESYVSHDITTFDSKPNPKFKDTHKLSCLYAFKSGNQREDVESGRTTFEEVLEKHKTDSEDFKENEDKKVWNDDTFLWKCHMHMIFHGIKKGIQTNDGKLVCASFGNVSVSQTSDILQHIIKIHSNHAGFNAQQKDEIKRWMSKIA